MGLKEDLEEMIRELGYGHMVTRSFDLYPDLVRQFIATIQVYYTHGRVKRTNEGTLTFLIRDVRYMLPLTKLCEIYGFENLE